MNVLYSKTGSSGNANVITDGSTMIQIDAGISSKKVNQGIDYRLSEVDALLVDHAHSDHTSNLKEYCKLGIEVYALQDVFDRVPNLGSKRHFHVIEYNKQFKIKTLIIVPFQVAHTNSDGTDCPNAGFLIYSTFTKEKMLFITDAGYIESKFPPVDYIMIECNHLDIEDYSEELEYVNTMVERRRIKSHLSLDSCVQFLKNQDLSKVNWIRLLHLTESQGNIYNNIYCRMIKEFPYIKTII